jgi:hypothetical protein
VVAGGPIEIAMVLRAPLDYHQVREIRARNGRLVDRSSAGWRIWEAQGWFRSTEPGVLLLGGP